MKAMEYILKDLSSRINYDELGNVYIDTACLSWFEDEFLIYMGISCIRVMILFLSARNTVINIMSTRLSCQMVWNMMAV